MEWRTIETHPEYEVSQSGLVRRDGKVLKPLMLPIGYYEVHLFSKSNRTHVRVHQLVGKTFISNPDNLPMLDHINRDKTDNRVENLRWVTRSENSVNADDRTNHRNIYKTKSGWNVSIKRNQQIIYQKHFMWYEEAQVNRTIQLLFI